MYEEIIARDFRRCPVPAFPQVEENDPENVGDVSGNQPAVGGEHRKGSSPAIDPSPDRV
jgi:hypothetical protein